MPGKTRTLATIQSRLILEFKEENGNKAIDVNDKVSKHVGGIPQVQTFINHLNTGSRFTPDELDLDFGEVPFDPSIFRLILDIAEDYNERGWTVK